ncbi:MAG TPA: regulatory protein RecX [Actinomycetota bacterium]|nr:regulatory protein RecX [Actinomycetota bacterium]
MSADRESRGKRKDIHERALGLLAVRQRSRRELERRLVQVGFERDEVSVELDRLERVGLVDDAAFARAVVESRMGRRAESRRAVAGKLAQAGVATDVAHEVLDQTVEDDDERAQRLAATKALRMGTLEPQVAFQRLYGFLARRGYSSDVARRAAMRALAVDGEPD